MLLSVVLGVLLGASLVLAWRVRRAGQEAWASLRVQRARAERHVAALEAVLDARREMDGHRDAIVEAICRAAARVTGAQAVALALPDAGELRLHGSAEGPADATTLEVFVQGVRRFERDGGLPPSLGVASTLLEPVVLGECAIGVLLVGWAEPLDVVDEVARVSVRLLAQEAAGALERTQLLEALRRLSHCDGLTGLANRRAWDDELPRELLRAGRHRYPVAVALLDLDHFKAYNDANGHQAGDGLLQEAARAWAQTLRSVDLIARWGGEEFAVALPGCGAEDALEVVERLRTALPDGRTCSAGLVVWDGVESARELVARADDALYAAKRGGRDRTIVVAP